MNGSAIDSVSNVCGKSNAMTTKPGENVVIDLNVADATVDILNRNHSNKSSGNSFVRKIQSN